MFHFTMPLQTVRYIRQHWPLYCKYHASCFSFPLQGKVMDEDISPQQQKQQRLSHQSNILRGHQTYESCQNKNKTVKGKNNISNSLSSLLKLKPVIHARPLDTNLKSNSYCQRRFYSKDINVTNENCSSTKNVDNGSKLNDSIQNDPWIKSLLADMRQDFDVAQRDTVVNVRVSNDDDTGIEFRPKDSDNINEISNVDIDKDYEYDYRYAGDDDIEEFGYFEEDDINKDAKPQRDLPISLNRGADGVFELEELMTLMEHLGADNIVSVPIPPEARYCDHMVIVTAKSRRHLQALNDEMTWVHKRKKSKKDPTLHIEGKDMSEWCAMDLGNLVLHIFLTEEKRKYYDIESLWLLGPENDPKCREDLDQSSFALTPEELYWMEVEGVKTSTTQQQQKD